MERLTGYDWPGNVRELANVVERALILANGPTLSFGADFRHAGKERSGELPARSDLSLDAARSGSTSGGSSPAAAGASRGPATRPRS